MFYVSLIVEILRARPRLVVWTAALVQAVLWTLIPALFYAAPPGGVPEVLAVGREFQLGTHLGPPLAFWLAEIAFKLAGTFGVYALAQVCVVTTYLTVFALGRAIVGPRHAALAVLLMAGIFVFTLPTPEFGPAIAAMPLWAIALLHYWRAVGEGRRYYWLPLALEMGLLLLTTYQGFVLIGLLLAVHASSPGAAARRWPPSTPGSHSCSSTVVVLPHLVWLHSQGDLCLPLPRPAMLPNASLLAWLRLLAIIVLLACGGLACCSRWQAAGRRIARSAAPAIQRRSHGSVRQDLHLFLRAGAGVGRHAGRGAERPCRCVQRCGAVARAFGSCADHGGRRQHPAASPAHRQPGLARFFCSFRRSSPRSA